MNIKKKYLQQYLHWLIHNKLDIYHDELHDIELYKQRPIQKILDHFDDVNEIVSISEEAYDFRGIILHKFINYLNEHIMKIEIIEEIQCTKNNGINGWHDHVLYEGLEYDISYTKDTEDTFEFSLYDDQGWIANYRIKKEDKTKFKVLHG
jgi:hypothetical protein